jgi:hypothetical protein
MTVFPSSSTLYLAVSSAALNRNFNGSIVACLQDAVLDFVWRDWENSRVHLSLDNRTPDAVYISHLHHPAWWPCFSEAVCSVASIFNKSGEISRYFLFSWLQGVAESVNRVASLIPTEVHVQLPYLR